MLTPWHVVLQHEALSGGLLVAACALTYQEAWSHAERSCEAGFSCVLYLADGYVAAGRRLAQATIDENVREGKWVRLVLVRTRHVRQPDPKPVKALR